MIKFLAQDSVQEFLGQSAKFKNIPVAPDKNLSCIIDSEKRMTYLFRSLNNKNGIIEGTYNKVRPVGSIPKTFHGSAKLHKPFKNDLSLFRLSLSAIGTFFNKLENFLVFILPDISQNEFKNKDSFSCVNEI